MDIAEIRKKAKVTDDEKSSAMPNPTATAEPAVAPAPTPDLNAVVVGCDPSELVPDSPIAATGLDRLFAGLGGTTEEACQLTLASQDTQEGADFCQYLAFQLGPEEYALDINRISEIIKPREYTDIPRIPEFILGLISLRGVVVPIFDLRRRFKLGVAQLSPASRIIVCREEAVAVGLLVDSINQVIRLAADRIEPPPAVLSGFDRNLVDGVGRFQGRMIILLNLASVLDVEMA